MLNCLNNHVVVSGASSSVLECLLKFCRIYRDSDGSRIMTTAEGSWVVEIPGMPSVSCDQSSIYVTPLPGTHGLLDLTTRVLGLPKGNPWLYCTWFECSLIFIQIVLILWLEVVTKERSILC